MGGFCPYCKTPYDEAISPDDCCHGAEAAALRRKTARLSAALTRIASGSLGAKAAEYARDILDAEKDF